MTERKVAVIVGVGPGIGGAVARRFAGEGHAVALAARSPEKLAPVAEAIENAGGVALPVPMDATDAGQVEEAFARIRSELGDPSVLVYNAGAFHIAGLLEIDTATFERSWRINCLGAFHCAQQVLPAMVDAGRGTLLFTGATGSLRGGARFSCLAVGKFGLRALAQSMAREFGPQGVHVAHVIIDGMVDLPRTRSWMPDKPDEAFLAPDAVAEAYWALHSQHPSTWTHEIDLRPATESF